MGHFFFAMYCPNRLMHVEAIWVLTLASGIPGVAGRIRLLDGSVRLLSFFCTAWKSFSLV